MNDEWWFIQSISDIGSRILVSYERDNDEVLSDNNIQDDWEAKEEINESIDWWDSI